MIGRIKDLLKSNPSESSTKKITVLISTLTGKEFSVSVKNTDNILDLKNKLESQSAISHDQMILMHNINDGKAKALQDTETLQSSDIQDKTHLKMILRL